MAEGNEGVDFEERLPFPLAASPGSILYLSRKKNKFAFEMDCLVHFQ